MRIEPDEIRSLRQWLSPEPEGRLSQQRFSELIGVTWGTVARWERKGCPDGRSARKLTRLRLVLDALGDMIKREYRLTFFIQRHPLLLHLCPITLLESEAGLLAVLRQIEGG